MPTILQWVLVSLGVLFLLLLLGLVFRALKLLRLRRVILRFLSLQDAGALLAYIGRHPQLLGGTAYGLARLLVDRTGARGDVEEFIFGVVHLGVLDACREQGVEAVRQTMAGRIQAGLVAMRQPAWKRALEILGNLATTGKADFAAEELNAELVEAMDQVAILLRPLASEGTVAVMDEFVQQLRQALQRETEGK